MQNPRYANDQGGILVDTSEGVVYYDSGCIYDDLVNGVYGEIAAYEKPTESLLTLKCSEIRTERNRLLSECDWTQMPDSPVDKPTWAAYRQALRDIPSQDGFPDSVIWPTKPLSIIEETTNV